MVSIGDKIKLLRKLKGITQEELSDVLHISYQAISKWKTGKSKPDTTIIPIIAEYFKVTIDELFYYDKSDENQIKDSYFETIYLLLKISVHSRKFGLLSLENLKSNNQKTIIDIGIDLLIDCASSEYKRLLRKHR